MVWCSVLPVFFSNSVQVVAQTPLCDGQEKVQVIHLPESEKTNDKMAGMSANKTVNSILMA